MTRLGYGEHPLDSPVWQRVGVCFATIAIAVLHWDNDGLWFQGDAPRHAANGVFAWDWLTSLSADPLAFALSYYARYPVIAPVAYPPLFYALEGAAFGLVAPSPYLAKGLVLGFAATVGVFTMLWGRRWIGPIAGWAGAAVVLLPGFVRYSNAVLLNVPGTAIALSALYYLHRWLDSGATRHAKLFAALAVAALLTYYPAALVVPIGVVWSLLFRRRGMPAWPWLIPAFVLVAAVVATAAMPVHFARHAPSLDRLLNVNLWSYYWRAVLRIAGGPWVFLGLCGVLAAVAAPRRRELGLLATAAAAAIASLVALPAMSDRYVLMLGPLLVLSGFVAIAVATDAASRWRPLIGSATIVLVLGFGARSAMSAPVPIVSGIDRVADYLRERAPDDTVLYSGQYDGVFAFYVRAGDPDFRRRVVLSNKLLYGYAQNAKFLWIETPHVSSPADVLPLMEQKCGCRWVAVEVGSEHLLNTSERHLRRALEGPAFERVETFRVEARGVSRVDLYRFLLPALAPVAIDLAFPSFSRRVFTGVEPIRGRR